MVDFVSVHQDHSSPAGKQLTFTVPATLESAEHVSHAVMQMVRDLGKSATEELQIGSDVFQRFSTYLIEHPGCGSKVRCSVHWSVKHGLQLSLTDAA